MVRAAALGLLLLASCDKMPITSSETAYKQGQQAAEIERLKEQIAELSEENERQDRFAVGTHNDLADLRTTVNSNAKIANDNAKVEEDRWKWLKSHTH